MHEGYYLQSNFEQVRKGPDRKAANQSNETYVISNIIANFVKKVTIQKSITVAEAKVVKAAARILSQTEH